MPLTVLACNNTQVSDLSPLKGMKLRILFCDFDAKRDAEILRSMKSLGVINGKVAKQFWEDAGRK
jgi:hypothetical protein